MEKVSLFPLELPITLAKTFYSGPCDCVAAPRAAIPLRSPGAVEGLHAGRACVPAVSSCPCRRGHRLPARQREALSGRLRQQTRRGTGPAEAAQGLALPCRQFMAVAKAGPAFWASGAWRAAARHSEQSGQILRYGLPQIKKISVFCRQGPVTAPASFAGGEGQVRANSRTAAARARWAGSESGEKRGRREGRARAVRGKGRCRYLRTGRDAASGRSAKGACLVGAAPDGSMPEKGTSGCMCCSEALQSIGMSRADGSLHTCNDWGPCRRLQKLFPQ